MVLINILIFVTILLNITSAHVCEWTSLSHDAIYLEDVRITQPGDVLFFWKVSDDVNTVTIKFTESLNVTVERNGYSVFYDVRKNESSAPVSKVQNVSSSLSNANRRIPSLALVALSIIPIFLHMRKSVISIMVLLFLVSLVQTSTNEMPDCHHPSIVLEIPTKYIRKICINNRKCVPTVCQLHIRSDFSNLPSNRRTIFVDDFCTIRKPDRWNEWVAYWFNHSQSSDDLYFADHDQDGLVNLLEFYANNYSISQNISIEKVGSDPFKRDTDDDGLEDGYEYFHGLNVTVYDQRSVDYDGDGLSNIIEQQHSINPLLADTDGDNITDAEELNRLTCPNDASDRGQVDISLQHAFIKVTLGDPSSTQNYRIDIGENVLPSSQYNGDAKAVYKFEPGAYKITINHTSAFGAKFFQPFYSYTAVIQQIGGLASSMVIDEANLLGTSVTFTTFQSIEKKHAWLVVRRNCTSSMLRHQVCSCIDTCELCTGQSKCVWDNKHRCRLRRAGDESDAKIADCPCTRCSVWYRNDSNDKIWQLDLMKNFQCPCKVESIRFAGNMTRLRGLDTGDNITWIPDYNCMDKGLPFCQVTNHGASGCMLSSPSKYGARQQCCYDAQGNLIQSYRHGAGRARKSFSPQSYLQNDFLSFSQCCRDCRDPKQCSYFESLRQSSTTHCAPSSSSC